MHSLPHILRIAVFLACGICYAQTDTVPEAQFDFNMSFDILKEYEHTLRDVHFLEDAPDFRDSSFILQPTEVNLPALEGNPESNTQTTYVGDAYKDWMRSSSQQYRNYLMLSFQTAINPSVNAGFASQLGEWTYGFQGHYIADFQKIPTLNFFGFQESNFSVFGIKDVQKYSIKLRAFGGYDQSNIAQIPAMSAAVSEQFGYSKAGAEVEYINHRSRSILQGFSASGDLFDWKGSTTQLNSILAVDFGNTISKDDLLWKVNVLYHVSSVDFDDFRLSNTFSTLAAKPSISLHPEFAEVSIGADLFLQSGEIFSLGQALGNQNSLSVFPHLEARKTIGDWNIVAGVTGDYEMMNLRNAYITNRFIAPQNLSTGMWAAPEIFISADWRYQNYTLSLNTGYTLSTLRPFFIEHIHSSTSSATVRSLVYDVAFLESSLWETKAQASMAIQSNLAAYATLHSRLFSIDNLEGVPLVPALVANLGADWSPAEQWTISPEIVVASQRRVFSSNALVPPASGNAIQRDESLPAFLDFSISGEYTPTNRLSLYGNLNNLLNRNYAWIGGYQHKGFYAGVGLLWKF